MRHFPGGFRDPTYLAWERDYKVLAAERFHEAFGRGKLGALVRRGAHREVAERTIAIEARTNLLFSFEKMALRDAVKSAAGARAFAEGLFEFLYGEGPVSSRFATWCDVVAVLPRRQTRVLTWPVVTVFGFIAQPRIHFFLKPMVTRQAARRYGYDLGYQSRPRWNTYAGVLAFARRVRDDLRDLRPRDMIDLQSFLWVQGSDEYPG
jgi:hypothetical protein